MGPTGGGKTTLCLALNGIIPHSMGGTIGGRVLINGRDTRHHSVPELAQTVGLIFQKAETQLFNMTVEEEVAFGLETLGLPSAVIHDRIDWALSLVGMAKYRQRSPFGLSGGQKQRVAIAAILAMKPPVLVLDEPTANLDPIGKREVFAAVNHLRQHDGMTIIMVSHESEQIAEFGDRVAVLSDGKIAYLGSPQDIFCPPQTIQSIGLNVPQVSLLADCLNRKREQQLRLIRLNEAFEALKGIQLVVPLEKKPPESESDQPSSPQFVIEDLTYHYTGQQHALDQVSLTIQPGAFLGVIGQNGSGKTTLVKHLNGLLRPVTGRVLFDQVDITSRSVAQLAKRIGYVFQDPDHMIFSETVFAEVAAGLRNLGYDEAIVADQVKKTLAEFELHPYAEHQPTQLSFGLRRKVSVAAVVAMDTDVVILDEPTSGLDQRSTDELLKILQRLNRKGRTILMITHDMNIVARFIPEAVVMHQGKILAHQSTRDLFQNDALLDMAQLNRPQITQLARQLNSPWPALTPAELCQQLLDPEEA